MITPAQSRMARAAIGCSVRELAKRAQVGVSTVARFETGQNEPTKANLAAIQRALEEAGIRFTEHGVETKPE